MTSRNGNHDNFQRSSLFDLKDRVALVTGGGSGIGLMIAQAFAVNGAKVYITGRTKEKLDTVVSTYGKDVAGELIPVVTDVTDKGKIAELVDFISQREKCLCILVNNAGISGEKGIDTEKQSADELKKTLFDSDKNNFEDWDQVHRTNVSSIYFVTTAFLPLLQKSTELHKGWSGAVINIVSISGVVLSAQKHFAYNSSKAAAKHLNRMLASELTSSGLKIRINAISPGVFPSEMTAGDSDESQKSQLPKDRVSDLPAERPGKDEDMANAALFVATNQYLNGHNLILDGGFTLSTGM